ncbi:MAG: HAMP domain-containing sensor histidine kinase [Christensenellales bacterium]|nr:HAMP domain-containing sensor histidine kinase [Christensenellales bacterium]
MEAGNIELLHDLRLPLQLISSCGQMLEEEFEGNEGVQCYLRMILASTAEMQSMLRDAMDAHKEAAKGNRELYGDLVGRTREICAGYRLCARQKRVELTFDANVRQLITSLDTGKYSRILMNLLSNALRFTLPGGHIRVETLATGEGAEVRVLDDGCGMSSDRLERIFDAGFTHGGSGYGLPAARRCATELGGMLWAESSPGKGSRFFLWLPIRSSETA